MILTKDNLRCSFIYCLLSCSSFSYIRSLRAQGIDATACHFYANRYQFESDICLNLQDYPKHKRLEKIQKFFKKAIEDYDVFHFHFGGTFFPDKRDLELLHKAGKKMVVHHRGSDARILSVA